MYLLTLYKLNPIFVSVNTIIHSKTYNYVSINLILGFLAVFSIVVWTSLITKLQRINRKRCADLSAHLFGIYMNSCFSASLHSSAGSTTTRIVW